MLIMLTAAFLFSDALLAEAARRVFESNSEAARRACFRVGSRQIQTQAPPHHTERATAARPGEDEARVCARFASNATKKYSPRRVTKLRLLLVTNLVWEARMYSVYVSKVSVSESSQNLWKDPHGWVKLEVIIPTGETPAAARQHHRETLNGIRRSISHVLWPPANPMRLIAPTWTVHDLRGAIAKSLDLPSEQLCVKEGNVPPVGTSNKGASSQSVAWWKVAPTMAVETFVGGLLQMQEQRKPKETPIFNKEVEKITKQARVIECVCSIREKKWRCGPNSNAQLGGGAARSRAPRRSRQTEAKEPASSFLPETEMSSTGSHLGLRMMSPKLCNSVRPRRAHTASDVFHTSMAPRSEFVSSTRDSGHQY